MVERAFAVALAAVAGFAVLAQGAHDLWAATAVHLAAVGLAAAWLARAALSREGAVSTRLAPPVLLVIGAFWISWRGSVNPGESLLALKDWGATLILLLLAAEVFRADETADLFLKASAPILWLELGVILRQRAERLEYALPHLDSAAGWLWFILSEQVPGTILNANATAAFLIAWLGMLGKRFVEDRSRGEGTSPVLLSALAACALSLILLNSLWAFVCLTASLPIIAGPRRTADWARRNPGRAGWAAAGGLALVALILAWKFGHRIDWTGELEPQGEAFRRLDWWRTGARMLVEYPFFGVGLGNYPSAYPAFAEASAVPSAIARHTRFAHGALVTLAAETGLGGLMALGTAGFWLRRLARNTPCRPAYGTGLILLLLYLAVSIGIEFPGILVTAAIFAGAALAPAAKDRRRPRASVGLVAVAAAAAAVPWLTAPFFASRLGVEGELALLRGDAERALQDFTASAELDPRSFEAQRGRARTHALRFQISRNPWDWEAAISAQRRAVELNHLDPRLRRELSELEAPARSRPPKSGRRNPPPGPGRSKDGAKPPGGR